MTRKLDACTRCGDPAFFIDTRGGVGVVHQCGRATVTITPHDNLSHWTQEQVADEWNSWNGRDNPCPVCVPQMSE